MGRRSLDELFHRPDEVNPAKCAKRSIHNASHLLVASKFASGTFPTFLMAANSCHLLVMGLEQCFLCHLRSTHRWVSQLMFFEMRHAAAPAFKRTYIGQCAETLRPSNQSHVPSAAWAQRQLRLRAFSIHDEARFSAIHARLHWLSLLVEHSLAVVEAREHTIQTCAKTRTDGALIHYKRVGHRSPPPHYNERHERLRPPVIKWIGSFVRMQSIRQSVQNGQFLCGLAQKPARCLVASHADK
jgi:hypothetical protein